MFGDIIQPTHLLFVLVVALLVLGPKRLPEVGRSLGKGIRDFRHGMQGVQDEARSVFHDVTGEHEEGPTASELSQSASAPSVGPAVTAPDVTGPAVTAPAATVAAVAEPVSSATVTSAGGAGGAVTQLAPPPAFEPDPADYAD